MGDERYLIVNADDFGLTEGVNLGIIEAHQHGIVTSTSLLVRAPAAAHAVAMARSNPELGLGLHFDIGEWVVRDGEWIALYQRVPDGDAQALSAELEEQVALFIELTGTPPDHLDSHQHVHIYRREVASAVSGVAVKLGIGVRRTDPRVGWHGGLYGQDGSGRKLPNAIEPDAYIAAIRNLGSGATEFGCHPGYADRLDSEYRTERELELRSLCDGGVRAAITESGVRLITWRDVKRLVAV